MIRSAERPAAPWHGVPAGFKVAWPVVRRGPGRRPESLGALPLQIARGLTALLAWQIGDYLRSPRRQRQIVLRLAQAKPAFGR